MKRLVTLAFLALATSAPTGAEAQDTEWNRYTLKDLGGVYVRLDVDDSCQAAGITAANFEAGVSMSLIEAEVGVLTQEEMLQHPAMPELRVSVDCAVGSNGSSSAMAYAVELRVQQAAQMLRDTQITLPEAVTWFSSEVGASDTQSAVDAVGATLAEQVAAFATAWTEIHAGDAGGV